MISVLLLQHTKKVLGCIGIFAVLCGGGVHAESYQQVKKDIMQEIYSDERYLPVIDIKQATIDLNSLTSSLERMEEHESIREEQQSTINERIRQLKIAISTILKDTATTAKEVKQTLQSIAIVTRKIQENQANLTQIATDTTQVREALGDYLNVMYRMHLNTYDQYDQIDLLRMVSQYDDMSYVLSENHLVELMTVNLHTLLQTLDQKEQLFEDLTITYIENKQRYTDGGRDLKKHMDYLEQQKTSVFELIAYLRSESAQVAGDLDRIEASQESFVTSKELVEKIVHKQNRIQDTELYRILNQEKRPIGDNYFTRPFVGKPEVIRWHDKSGNGIRFAMEQGDPLYSPAPGIVHSVQREETLDLSRVVVLHKDGYATFFSPLSEVFVQEGDIITRGTLLGRAGGKPGTRGAGIDSLRPHIDISVMKSGKPLDPLSLLDLTVFDEAVIIGRYQKQYITDQGQRQVYVSKLDRMKGLTLEDRTQEFLSIYAPGPFGQMALWKQGSQGAGINPIFGICIGFAETSFKNFKTPNNIGNVGNDDRGRTVTFASPLAGIQALFGVFNNQYLGEYTLLNQLSRFGNESGFIYASSPYNRQKNIMNCMTSIYGYRVPEDFPIRIPQE